MKGKSKDIRELQTEENIESLEDSRGAGPLGRLVQAFPDGTLLIELTRPSNNGPFGFVISRGKGRPDSGIYVERVADASTENIYTGLLGVGDEILEVNGEIVAGLTLDQGYYKRSPHYVPIRNWKRIGCHPAPMIHSTMLIDLRRRASAALAFYPVHHYYLWALDDIMAFAFSAKQAVDFKMEILHYLHIVSEPKDTMACNQVVELQQQQVLVLEGDLRFEPSFKSSLNTIREDGKQLGLQWDLPNGAKTVLEAQPLSKMLPVNEFLPVMFNKHPKSNTETSTIWDEETVATDWDHHHISGDHSRGAKSPSPISESSPRDKLLQNL
ncbi:hypothetical protein cypCar_00022353 [Cyprinus carpio]|nr:hypothetical protein cypCar_00022353 [Cyprinus carpio]